MGLSKDDAIILVIAGAYLISKTGGNASGSHSIGVIVLLSVFVQGFVTLNKALRGIEKIWSLLAIDNKGRFVWPHNQSRYKFWDLSVGSL